MEGSAHLAVPVARLSEFCLHGGQDILLQLQLCFNILHVNTQHAGKQQSDVISTAWWNWYILYLKGNFTHQSVYMCWGVLLFMWKKSRIKPFVAPESAAQSNELPQVKTTSLKMNECVELERSLVLISACGYITSITQPNLHYTVEWIESICIVGNVATEFWQGWRKCRVNNDISGSATSVLILF